MIPSTPTHAFQVNDSASAVLALLYSKGFMPDRPITMPRACAKIDGSGTNAKAAPRASAPLPCPRSHVAIGDWDAMFGAVTARLSLIVAKPLATTAASQPADAADRIRVAVLECVAALDQLHATLKFELGQRSR